MSHFSRIYKTAMIVLGLVYFAGCAATDDDKIGDAQFCLDDLPVTGLSVGERTSKVNTCLSKLGTLSTKQASLIRCSANFLIEGFGDPTRIVSAMENVGNQQGGASGTVAMMNVLKFSSQATAIENSNLAEQTFSYCQEAGNPGYVLIASFSKIATSLSEIATVNLSDGLSQTEVNTIMTQSPEIIGATANVAYQTSCSEGENANSELCSQLGAAITSGATEAEIGEALLNAWKSQ